MGHLAFTVKPNIPVRLKSLEELARNLWISWNFEAIMLFMRLDYDAWLQSRQNPVRMLGMVAQEKLEQAARDDSFLAALDTVCAKFQRYLGAERWYKGPSDASIAYFSMEYGLDVALPVYSGGLGMLSGDHLKTSSDLGLPLVGVGLLYRQGYFQQYLNVGRVPAGIVPGKRLVQHARHALPRRKGSAHFRPRGDGQRQR